MKATKIESVNTQMVNIYPNPAIDRIYIEGIGSKPAMLSIVDLNGKLTLTTQVANKDGININDLKSGIYSVKLNGMIFKLVVNHE